MPMDDSDLLLLGALGLGAWYLWDRERRAIEEAVLVGQPLTPKPTTPTTVFVPPPTPTPVEVTAVTVGNIATGFLTPILGPLAPVVGIAAVAEITVGGQAIWETFEGNLSTGNVLTDVALLTGPLGWGVLGVGKLLGIDLFGHDLDDVNDILLNPFNSPITANNVQFGRPIYAVAKGGVLHQIVPGTDINTAHFSWREIIAVDPRVIDAWPSGLRGGMITSRDQIEPEVRPRLPADIRRLFGCDAIFNVGNTTDMYGPPALFGQAGNPGWLATYAPASSCAPDPTGPYGIMQLKYAPDPAIQVAAAQAIRIARF